MDLCGNVGVCYVIIDVEFIGLVNGEFIMVKNDYSDILLLLNFVLDVIEDIVFCVFYVDVMF